MICDKLLGFDSKFEPALTNWLLAGIGGGGARLFFCRSPWWVSSFGGEALAVAPADRVDDNLDEDDGGGGALRFPFT